MATELYSFAAVSLPTGQTQIPLTPVVGYTTSLSFLLSQSILGNSGTGVEIDLEVSYDGGLSFLPGGSTTHNGNSGTSMGGIFSYSQSPTHIRGTITVTSGPIRLAGSLAVS